MLINIFCQPHQCPSGALVDERGIHELSCRRMAPADSLAIITSMTIWRAISRARVPATKEPVGLVGADGKRRGGLNAMS
jgi:hypothetical protein